MLICGVKVSHDGGVAVIDGNKLIFSIEVEKLANGRRYSALGDLDRIGEILRSEGIEPADVDQFVVDGWWAEGDGDGSQIPTATGGQPMQLPVAPYVEGVRSRDPLHRHEFTAFDFGGRRPGYVSYHHASNHLIGAYSSSPFPARGEDALVVVWDGAMVPRAYHVAAAERQVRSLGPLFPLVGNIFADFCANFEPYYRDRTQMTVAEYRDYHLSIAGKAMAYAALGTVEEAAFSVFDDLLRGSRQISRETAFDLGNNVTEHRSALLPGLSDADIIATFQAFLGNTLVTRLTALAQKVFPGIQVNLAIGGGCALNIKWNSALRKSGAFREVWIPPFPNDSGAAIGTAACEMFRERGQTALDWSVYSGPRLRSSEVPSGWLARQCDERELAWILHHEGVPVTVLSGRAELGPRALGNRSILAPATDPAMKDHLNLIKGRASYRPVAPICLATSSAQIFEPGGNDPYMIFDHQVRSEWLARVPAIVHLDRTARLQTIEPSSNTAAARILLEYEKISGIPLLCNTSANHNGHGFFPDVASAASWGGTRHIWSDGMLYVNKQGA
ncbi:MAG: hypothetical protein HOV77_11395 [Hamadaea sp.]|uniref:carbamoyltransferase N-terminal domain-containing protein n=1 Tax=Hamadaea sp. TaxID=2024425 RepID=UPI00180F5FC9|nr:carbamoyltransferase N-terminal domain-containing protein [Hamadaea sp.]NUT19784.1 hypothetical protein [Hamadaea sp.]